MKDNLLVRLLNARRTAVKHAEHDQDDNGRVYYKVRGKEWEELVEVTKLILIDEVEVDG